MGKLELNKKKKKDALFNTAFELFTTKGLTKTTISDIVEQAGVAKGTFYLYLRINMIFATNWYLIRPESFSFMRTKHWNRQGSPILSSRYILS